MAVVFYLEFYTALVIFLSTGYSIGPFRNHIKPELFFRGYNIIRVILFDGPRENRNHRPRILGKVVGRIYCLVPGAGKSAPRVND